MSDLTPSERAIVQPRRRSPVRPFFRLACILLVAAMFPLPWSKHTSCAANFSTYTVTKTGQDLLLHHPESVFPTVIVLALAIAAPFLALRLDRLPCLLADLFCFLGILFLSGGVALEIAGPLSVPLPAGEAALATLLVTAVDAFVALFMDARADPPRRPPDDTG